MKYCLQDAVLNNYFAAVNFFLMFFSLHSVIMLCCTVHVIYAGSYTVFTNYINHVSIISVILYLFRSFLHVTLLVLLPDWSRKTNIK